MASDREDQELTALLSRHLHPLVGDEDDHAPIVSLAGGARFVLLGESTHGTHEFYRERARITRALIQQHGFSAVAIEGDWPDAARVNRWVRGQGDDPDAEAALSGFRRFPTWMWRNADVLDFVGWLRSWNEGEGAARPVGFYGLDMYSLHTSIEAVLGYLDKIDPTAAAHARERYGCFDRFGQDPQSYGYFTQSGRLEDCENAVVRQLLELRQRGAAYLSRDGQLAKDEQFAAEQNARLVKNAEAYYRAMYRGRDESWNLRDTHMADTLQALGGHLGDGRPAKIVVWAHNSHCGDARATDAGLHGELTLGQLARERWGDDAILVGFSTYTGSVTAASAWDSPAEHKRVRPGLAGGWEALMHATGAPRASLVLRTAELMKALDVPRLARAIGVLYLPTSERQSHYFRARLGRWFDALIHIDRTRAVEPIDRPRSWRPDEEPPETFPTGL